MIKALVYILTPLLFSHIALSVPMYFCTAANQQYFACLINLIGCIHKHHYQELDEIAVFDLGLTSDQIRSLQSIQKVNVYTLENIHPDLLTPFNTRPKNQHGGKPVPGWYAWKAVAIKQALDMFPLVLWIDAGTTILKPITALFEYIHQEHYFLHDGVDLPIRKQASKHQINLFDLHNPDRESILDACGLEAGLMGFTKRMYDSFIYPIYQLAHDLRNFADDGTSEGGFGSGRHDTTIFSIAALVNGLKIHHHSHNRFISLRVKNTTIPFHITGLPIPKATHIYITRTYMPKFKENSSYIIYKEK